MSLASKAEDYRDRANYYDSMAADARKIAGMIRDWMDTPELRLVRGDVWNEAFEWEDAADRLEFAAGNLRRKAEEKED